MKSQVKKRAITFGHDFSSFRIYIDGLLHICVNKKAFYGLQSYNQEGIYYIEFWIKCQRQLIAHENKEIWVSILKIIDENL